MCGSGRQAEAKGVVNFCADFEKSDFEVNVFHITTTTHLKHISFQVTSEFQTTNMPPPT